MGSDYLSRALSGPGGLWQTLPIFQMIGRVAD
jgi:hypothetical protein